MPSDEVRRLGDVAHLQQGKWLPLDHQVERGAAAVYGANGITGYTEHGHHAHPVAAVGCRGTCGVVHVAPAGSWIGNNAMAVWPKDTCVLRFDYLVVALRAADMRRVTKRNAQPMITRAGLSELLIRVPDRLQQSRVVHLLSQADAHVEAATHEVTVCRDVRQHVLADLRRRFNSKAAAPLSAVASVQKGTKPGDVRDDAAPGLVPYLSTSTLRSGADMLWVDGSHPKMVAVRDGDVLVAWDGSAGQVFAGQHGAAASTMAVVRPADGHARWNAALQLTLLSSTGLLQQTAKGTSIPHVDGRVLRDLPVPDLSDDEAYRVAQVISETARRLSAAEHHLSAAAHIRDELLHDLLSGNHTIPDTYDRVLESAA